MKRLDIGIIGMGPRGLTVLERIIAYARVRTGDLRNISVFVIDPDSPGPGVHKPEQPDYWMLNTVAGLPTLFPGTLNEDVSLHCSGPSLIQWLNGRGENVHAHDFVPRRCLGEYLQWFYRELRGRCPENLTIEHIQAEAIALERIAGRERVRVSTGVQIDCDVIVLATGHTPNRADVPDRAPLVVDVYRELDRLRALDRHDVVGIEGFGLTALDAVAALTIGKGGHFGRHGERTEYHPSGEEPRLVLYSRSGLPGRARPARDDGCFAHVPSPALHELTAMLCAQRRSGNSLSFMEQIWPTLRREMRIAYFHACLERAGEATSGSDVDDAWLGRMADRFGRWDVDESLRCGGMLDLSGSAGYQSSVLRIVEADLLEARQGLSSPLKRGLEVLLHLREQIRAAVDHSGLTAESHEHFYTSVASSINRNVIGPQLERMEELIALAEAGILSVPLGPAPRIVPSEDRREWIVSSSTLAQRAVLKLSCILCGRSESPRLDRTASSLLESLFNRGRIRPSRQEVHDSTGVAVTTGLNAIDADGAEQGSLYVVGPLCEGSTYYNHYVPTLQAPSTPFLDAEKIVSSIFRRLASA